jgi:hypothetical protein
MGAGFFDIKSANWMGGVNVVTTVTMFGVLYLAYKAYKK